VSYEVAERVKKAVGANVDAEVRSSHTAPNPVDGGVRMTPNPLGILVVDDEKSIRAFADERAARGGVADARRAHSRPSGLTDMR
jgi:hypothetical protein